MKSAIIIILLGFVAAGALSQFVPKRLRVSVYYETLCGDSRRFIRSQLYPVKTSPLGEHFDVELIPYGKASTVKVSPTSYSFECQHGKPECEGNKMHACALKYINSTALGLDFIKCSMSSSYPPTSLEDCSDTYSIDTTDIQKCIDSFEGQELLAQQGEKTNGLSPKLYFVPWITFNDEFTSENLQASQTDFRSVVCSELVGNGVRDTGC